MSVERISKNFPFRSISPYREMGAYESLWTNPQTTFKSLAKRFAQQPESKPSDFVPEDEAQTCAQTVTERLNSAGIERFGIMVHGSHEYPRTLRDPDYPVECLYYQGWWNLVESPSVAVIGARKASQNSLARTRRLVRELVKNDYTVVSGLAAGIDRVAHETALNAGGRTIAVLGTPLSHVYPKENADLQRTIAREFLVLSQIPVLRYEAQDYRRNRLFFPERNITMAALTQATIIVEASDTSGTLIQARSALAQGRKLFILDSCFQYPHLRWPARLAKQGAIRVRDYHDIQRHLPKTIH
ncbi:MAG: DNA-protecting protein DprA [Aestuariivita sp.]|nr:DNA-protecting protein DprA [Aestuariivita sp.]